MDRSALGVWAWLGYVAGTLHTHLSTAAEPVPLSCVPGTESLTWWLCDAGGGGTARQGPASHGLGPSSALGPGPVQGQGHLPWQRVAKVSPLGRVCLPYLLSVLEDAWLISLLAMKFLISEK